MRETGFPEWDEKYRVLCCLKESADKKTYLLEERDGPARKVCKIASCGQAVFLRREYEMMRQFSGVWNYETLELREKENTCALLRDYLQGRTLAELVEQDGVLETEEAARLGIRLCGILEVLHEETPPVIHRDLKPENILVTGSGRIRLIDFETARFYQSGRETDTVRLGTRGYAAPEQFGHGQTDARTDIYAVGKLLLYMTTGDCKAEPSAAGRRGREFGTVIGKCCAYDPDRRYANAGELEKALRGLLENRPLLARRFPGDHRLALWGARPVAAMAAITVLCLLSGLTGAMLARRLPQKQTPAAEEPVWNPAVYREYVDRIVLSLQEDNCEEAASACETLVKALQERDVLRGVEPVAYWELDGEELDRYNSERLGFEFIADRLAYGDGLAFERIGTYSGCADALARDLRTCIDYTWTKDDGTLGSSALHDYVVLGDDRNLDGCMIEILDGICRVLGQIPEGNSERDPEENPWQKSG